MEPTMTFGEYVFERRRILNLGIREFCMRTGYDASSWSKMERGFLPAPRGEDILQDYAMNLGVEVGGEDWQHFKDLADLSRGLVPKDILIDKELVGALPLFFRTVRGGKPTPEDVTRLIEALRRP